MDSRLAWSAELLCLDRLVENPATAAAYCASLQYLESDARPHWIVSSNSDGRNLFGRRVCRAGLVAGWVSGDGEQRPAPRERLLNLRPLTASRVRWVARRLADSARSRLLNGAFHAIMPRTSSVC